MRSTPPPYRTHTHTHTHIYIYILLVQMSLPQLTELDLSHCRQLGDVAAAAALRHCAALRTLWLDGTRVRRGSAKGACNGRLRAWELVAVRGASPAAHATPRWIRAGRKGGAGSAPRAPAELRVWQSVRPQPVGAEGAERGRR